MFLFAPCPERSGNSPPDARDGGGFTWRRGFPGKQGSCGFWDALLGCPGVILGRWGWCSC